MSRSEMTKALSLRRYVGTIRRSIYEKEKSKLARSSSSIGRIIKAALASIGRRLAFAAPYLQPLTRRFRRNELRLRLLWISAFGPALLTLRLKVLRHRRTLRIFAGYIVPASMELSRWAAGMGLTRFSHRLIEHRIPVVSGATRYLIAIWLSVLLSAQLTAGHVGNALSLARLINLAFRPYIRARRLPISFLYFQALFYSRQYHRIVAEVPRDELIKHYYLNHIIGVSYLYSNKPERAVYYLLRAIHSHDQNAIDFRMLGRAYLLLDETTQARRCFERSVKLSPNTVMAHQNYAGRYEIAQYRPKDWELREAGQLLIYDNYGQLAEDFFLLGNYDKSSALYQKMLDYQVNLRVPLPGELIARLAALDPKFDASKPVRLLPYEWVTQFGHIGLLDSYIKMLKLGMYPNSNCVLLAPKKMVSNHHFLQYWDRYFTIVSDENLVNDLFPYQRMVGDGFMAYPATGGRAEHWTRAAARAQIRWAEEGRAPLLSISAEDNAAGRRALDSLGVPAGAWYVGLHVREGGYYSESTTGMSVHRNAQVEDYIAAVKAVTDRGGYVIRLGDSTMRPLPPMERVIDYALSGQKSPQCDIFFCATSRFVIGTTSGLTTACLSFGTPMVLVNCISNDWQLWTKDTDFILKQIWDMRNKRFLNLAETYSPPVQGYLINAFVMRRHGLEAVPNSAAEIADAVIYKLDLLDGMVATANEEGGWAMAGYLAALAHNPMMFGAARPALPWLKQHANLLEPDRAHVREVAAS